MRPLVFASVVFGVLAWSIGHAWSDDPRIAAIQRAYVARCTPDLMSQGMSAQKAETVCTCAFSGMLAEIHFGTPGDRDRYEKMIQAQPKSDGSADERRLFGILSGCFSR